MEVKHFARYPNTPKIFRLTFSAGLIISVGIFLRVLTLLLLPNAPSSLAPDEGTYARLVSWLTSGNNALSFPEFGDGLYRSGRVLILPSIALNHLGLSSLDAVRVVSLAFGIFNIFLFNRFLNVISQNVKHSRLKKFVLLIYVLLPSHLVWGTLGLRESINEFGVLLTFYFLRKVLTGSEGNKVIQMAVLILGLSITFNIRPQVGLMIALVVVFSILLNYWKQPLIVFSIFLIPILNLLANSVPLGIPKAAENISSKVSTSPTEVLDFIQDKREGNQQFANSKIVISNCNQDQTRFTNLKCEIMRLPNAILQVTLRPMPLYDKDSSAQIAAGLENLFWIFIYVFIILNLKELFKKRYFSFQVPAVVFISLFTLAAALYEGNVGTAFRHKGLLLSLLLLVAFSLYTQKSVQMPRSKFSKRLKRDMSGVGL